MAKMVSPFFVSGRIVYEAERNIGCGLEDGIKAWWILLCSGYMSLGSLTLLKETKNGDTILAILMFP